MSTDQEICLAPTDIAIIGMAVHLPGARDTAEFWQKLRTGQECIAFYSDDALRASGVTQAALDDPHYVRAKAELADIDRFDAAFFGFSPREAALMDPQQRLFLECCWSALEDAGYDSDRFPGLIGVFGGARLNTYLLANLYQREDPLRILDDLVALTGNDSNFVTTRVSYKLNLRGPSVHLQTACSTSLVAVALACQSLIGYQSDIALAGGVRVTVPQKSGYYHEPGGIFSPDGHCRAFDASAQGTVFGDGVGIVVLRRLEDALRDGDNIRAVIKAAAINNDGSAKVGYTAPGIDGQAELIATTLAMADITPDSISYVEAHGTATRLGDPIEVAALTRAYRALTRRRQYCGIGSVKTNIGHLGAVAGVAGLVKTVLALEHRLLPPSLHFVTPNPEIDFENSPFFVVTSPAPWEANGAPRRAAINSFGIGGTNAHAILEEAPAVAAHPSMRHIQLLPISAGTPDTLRSVASDLARHLREHPELPLADVAYTLAVGRRHHAHRRIVLGSTAAETAEALETPEEPGAPLGRGTDAPRLVFLFPGQGGELTNATRRLYRTEPRFRSEVDRCCELLQRHLFLDLRTLLYPEPAAAERARAELFHTALAQPALFVVEYALARLLEEWGLRPAAMIGHSLGELVAACLAGVFPLEVALPVIAERGQWMGEAPGGSMLGVSLPESDLRPLLWAGVSIAAINTPRSCVVSGPHDAVAELERMLAAEGIAARRLRVSHAFHSAMMEDAAARFATRVRRERLGEPTTPFIAGRSGTWITPEEARDPAYWGRHILEPVRFADGIGTILADENVLLLEVGTGTTLTGMARRHPRSTRTRGLVPMLPQRPGRADDSADALEALGRCWIARAEIDWTALFAGEPRRRVALPTYPFARQRYWIDPPAADGREPHPSEPSIEAPRRQPIERWFSVPAWRFAPAPSPSPDAPEGPSCWLIFTDGIGLGGRISAQLVERGATVVSVGLGERLERRDVRSWILPVDDPAAYRELLAALAVDGMLPQQIVHLWNVTAPDEPHDFILRCAFDGLLGLLQAVVGQALAEVALTVVSTGLCDVAGNERVQPAKALLLGPVKVGPQEHPMLRARSVDIEWPDGPAQVERSARRLLAELLGAERSGVVAHRGDSRWMQTFEPTPLGPGTEQMPIVHPGGTYLITGGLGGIGLALGESLARGGAKHLILTARSSLPPRNEWNTVLAHGAEPRVAERILGVRRLEALGAEVLVVRTDTTSAADTARLEALIVDRCGGLDGAIHAAGVPGGGLLRFKTIDDAHRVMAPKVEGARQLLALAERLAPGFVLFCSSIAAVSGGFGQVDYCAANNYLDAIARLTSRTGRTRVVSVSWDLWSEVGMGVETAAARARIPAPAHPYVGQRSQLSDDRVAYRLTMSAAQHWVLREHRLQGRGLVPGTALLEMARAVFAAETASQAVELRDAFFLSPLFVEEDGAVDLRTILMNEGEAMGFSIVSRPAGSSDAAWVEHARGHASVLHGLPGAPPVPPSLRDELSAVHPERFVASLDPGTQWSFGPRWMCLTALDRGCEVSFARLELPQAFRADDASFALHPALLDVGTSFVRPRGEERDVFIPAAYALVRQYRPMPACLFSHVRRAVGTGADPSVNTYDVWLLDEGGVPVVEIRGFTNRRRSIENLREAKLPEPLAGGAPAADIVHSPTSARAITPAEGGEVFRRILAADLGPQVVVSLTDPNVLLQEAAGPGSGLRTLEKLGIIDGGQTAPARGGVTYARPDLARPYVAPRTPLETQLCEVWQHTFGVDRIGADDDFFELGGDSVLGIQIMMRLRDRGFQIELDTLFANPTIAALARAVPGSGEGGDDAGRCTDTRLALAMDPEELEALERRFSRRAE